MSNYNITFKILKDICKSVKRGDDAPLIEFLNGFRGNDTLEKFKNILWSWENDVSYTLNLHLNDTPTRIQISYLLSEFPQDFREDVIIREDDIEIVLGVPNEFSDGIDMVPIYNIIKQIKISGIFINLLNLSSYDKQVVINSLPAKVFSLIWNHISHEQSKILKFSNPVLEKFKFNFLTIDPYIFLKRLFTNFEDEYFMGVIFNLSKRIDGNLLMDSTPMEIEYYIQKYSEEMKSSNTGLTI